jgi:probable rRNA maturation factor
MRTRINPYSVNAVYKKRTPALKNLKKNVVQILKSEKRKRSDINIIFTKDSCLKELNARYRHKNYPTDVLSFPILMDEKGYYGGDIFISVEKAKENAKTYNATLKEELVRLVVHGVLHVLGYDHMKKNQEKKMKPKEEKYFKLFFPKAGKK